MVLGSERRQGASMRRVATIARFAIAAALLCGVAPSSAFAQGTLSESLTARVQAGEGKDRLLVEAKEIVYDKDNDRVSAAGDVELYYQGRTLQADRVTYDRKSGRVFAEGNARMMDASGAVITGSKFELTEDFKNGFIDSLRVEQTVTVRGAPIKTYFAAPRAERVDGDQTVFERGTYTACEPCREHPERPPLWQVKAARIIHNESEKTIYYENASLEFAGVPLAYMPYFWTPDPTVKRKTGLLAPHYITTSSLGTGVALPFFWNMAPNYDLTFQPTILSRQGVLGQAEWRHRLDTGSYNIRVAGIDQAEKSAFLPSPIGAGDRDWRGSLESAGRFNLNERWRWGWDIALLSDKWFLSNYRIRSESLSTIYLKESISTVYLQGQGDRSWFDVRGYYFKGLSTYDWQKQQPVVHPVLDYNKRIDGPRPLGGEVAFDLNLTSLTREAAYFQQATSPNFNLFSVVPNYAGYYETCTVFARGQCLLRGPAGTFTRLSSQVSWRRSYIDDAGQVWAPFAYIRADGFWDNYSTVGFQNAAIQNFVGGDTDLVGRVMPAVGLDYRYPFAATNGLGTHILEPRAQIIARPGETHIGRLPNEDAQSLVFDDTTIFDWNKFSGYDRVEGGVRANYGLEYSFTSPTGFYANLFGGQSLQVAGQNSFKTADLTGIGPDSGLDSRASDYVTRVLIKPNSYFTFNTRTRFGQDDLSLQRFETQAVANLNPILPLSTSLTYARYAPQPELGFPLRREGLLSTVSYNVTPRWNLTGTMIFDLDRYLTSRQTFTDAFNVFLANPGLPEPVYRRPSEWTPISTSLGVGYTDECTIFSVNYTRGIRQESIAIGEKERVQTVLVRLELRSLGELSFRQNLGIETVGGGEGVKAQ
jgi:LPS-assembly protein